MRPLRDLTHDSPTLGGSDLITPQKQAIIRPAAMLTLQCELVEQTWFEALDAKRDTWPKFAIERYARLHSTRRGILHDPGHAIFYCWFDLTPSVMLADGSF